MQRPFYLIAEDRSKLPVIIFDKEGIIGKLLAAQLTKEFSVLLISNEYVSLPNVVCIPWTKRKSKLLKNEFSQIFILTDSEKEAKELIIFLLRQQKSFTLPFYLISPFNTYSKRFVAQLEKEIKVHVILTGDIFGGSLPYPNLPNHLLQKAIHQGKIVLPNNGLDQVFPVAIIDVVSGILSAAFDPTKKSRFFYLFPRDHMTALSFARQIKNCDPLIQLQFVKEKKKKSSFFIPANGEYLVEKEYPLKKRIQEVFAVRTPVTFIDDKIGKGRGNKNVWQNRFLSLFIIFIILPFVLFVGGVGSGMYFLQESYHSLLRGEFESASKKATTATTAFSFAQKIQFPFAFLDSNRIGELTSTQIPSIETGIDTASLLGYIAQTGQSVQMIAKGKSANATVEGYDAINATKKALMMIQKLRAENDLPKKHRENLLMLSESLQRISPLVDSLPQLIGLNGKQRYLLLFQNNMELRPGGGFIGSYAIAELDGGKVTRFDIHDVYTLDGQFKGHVEPPAALKEYMGSSHWFLRDSNFAVDPHENADMASFFYNLEANEGVNGVIGIDVTFMQTLLNALGPIAVPNYKETLTANNFFQLTEAKVQNNFFPGSTQKKDFLQAAYNGMLEKAKQFSLMPQVAQTVITNIDQKHVVLWHANPEIQQVLAAHNLSPVLPENKESTIAVHDFVAITEANIGGNKVNNYLERSVRHKTEIIDLSLLQTDIEVVYKNASTQQSAFGGDYKNYLRFSFPKGSRLVAVKINGEEQEIVDSGAVSPTRKLLPSSVVVMTEEEKGIVTYGLLVTVAQESQKTITVTIERSLSLREDIETFAYTLNVVKQPGTLSDPYVFTLQYPEVLTPKTKSNRFRELPGELQLQTTLSTDIEEEMTLERR